MKHSAQIEGWFPHQSLFSDLVNPLYGILPQGAEAVEIGCWKGKSAAFLSDALATLGGRLITIDTFEGSDEPAHHEDPDVKAGRLEEVARQNLEGRTNVQIVRGRSVDILSAFSNASLDFIYIDGDHTYEGAKADIQLALQKLKPDGVIVGDDIEWPGVAQAVQECFRDREDQLGIRGRAWVYSPDRSKVHALGAFQELFIATPCYGGQCFATYMQSVVKTVGLFHQYGLKLKVSVEPGDSLVQRARNTMVRSFMANDSSHLLFIDSDIEFNPQDIVEMLKSDKDIICGVYPKKAYPIGWPVNYLPGSDQNLPVDQAGNVQIAEGPTGFMLIKRRVFDALAARHPDAHYVSPQPDGRMVHTVAFFDCGKSPDGRYLSEDFFFCQRWREAGGTVWAAPQVNLRHHGHHAFEGRYADEFKVDQAQGESNV